MTLHARNVNITNLRFFNDFLYSSVPTVFGNEQTQYVNVIKEMLMASLNDQGSYDVRFGAVKASVNYLLVHEKDNNILNHFKELLPPILTVSFTLQFFTTNVTNLILKIGDYGIHRKS